jgi:hypothetical protein
MHDPRPPADAARVTFLRHRRKAMTAALLRLQLRKFQATGLAGRIAG